MSAFGNPTFDNLENWVEILTSEHPFGSEESSSFTLTDNGCEGIVASLHVPVIYTRVGSVNFPQLKIAGVLYQYGEPMNIPKKSQRGNSSLLTVSTTVSFVDITSSPATKVPQWPVISIKLPTDFFYPFSSSPSKATRIIPTRQHWLYFGPAFAVVSLLL